VTVGNGRSTQVTQGDTVDFFQPAYSCANTVIVFTGQGADGTNLYQVNLSNRNALSQITQDGGNQSPLLGASGLNNQRTE
jgi:Tol biopolymer transport system component